MSLLTVGDQLLTGAAAAYLLALPLFAFAFAAGRTPTPATTGGTMPRIASTYAVVLTAGGWVLQLAHTVTLALAADRLPWGTMGEFVSAVVLAAIAAFLVLLRKYRIHYAGPFVMVVAVAGLALSATALYRPLPQLVPALHSYWLGIHVTAAIVAAGANTVGTVLAVLYLYRTRNPDRPSRLPAADVLNRVAHRTVMFAFPLWTLAIVTGAVWAEAAWGRYWGWDPKETWAFIAWLGYAAYLHARSTAGWRARRAAVICCVAYACVLFNLVVVNIWMNGLHSYAGL